MPNMGTQRKSASTKPVVKPPKITVKKGPAAKGRPGNAKVGPKAPLIAREVGATYRAFSPSASSSPGSLADALFTTTQQRVLGLIFGMPDRSFFANEIIGQTGSGSGAVQRELARLEASGLATVRWIGNQKHYQANKESPIFLSLWDIVQKTVGVAGPLHEALRPLAAQIRAAFVFGSVAKKQDTSRSDIDLMVISDSLSYADLFAALEPVNQRLGRPVNPTVFSEKDLARKLKDGNAFMKRVWEQPKIWLIGGASDLVV
jgi:predicted nucleotidyltransferase